MNTLERDDLIKRLEALVYERQRFADAMERAYNGLQTSDRRGMDEAANNYLLAVQTLKLARIEQFLEEGDLKVREVE